MDVDRFDGLARTLATTGTRRGLLLLASALPLVGGLLLPLTEGAAGPGGSGNGAIVGGGGGRRRRQRQRQRQRRQNRHDPGQHKDNRNDNDNDKDKDKDKNRNKSDGCRPRCPDCQRCNRKAQTCEPHAAKNGAVCAGSGATASRCCNGTCCDGCCAGGSCGACLVFATSTLQNGALGGLNGADAICQDRARAGGLPGTYRAWLSDDTGSPSTRFRCTAAACSGQGYQLPDQAQTLVATDWTDLTDGSLINAINVTELGGTVPPSPEPAARTWSNTAADGTVRTDVPDDDLACDNWTFVGNPPTEGVFGGTGTTTATNEDWTVEGSSPCGVPRRLYCFQQE